MTKEQAELEYQKEVELYNKEKSVCGLDIPKEEKLFRLKCLVNMFGKRI